MYMAVGGIFSRLAKIVEMFATTPTTTAILPIYFTPTACGRKLASALGPFRDLIV